MRNVATITSKELKSYIGSPLAYVSGFVFLIVMSFAFLVFMEQAYIDEVLFKTTGVMVWVLMFVAPAITMHLFAEERRSGTIELLMTYPLQDWEVVAGKFLAALILFLALISVTALMFPAFLMVYGNPDPGTILTNYIGIILLGASFLALGVLASALTKSQTVSAMIAIGILFGLMLCYGAADIQVFGLGPILAYLSPIQHYVSSFGVGTLNTRDLVYFLTFILFSLFVAVRVVEIKRWQ